MMKLAFLVLFLLGACNSATGTSPPKPTANQMTNPDVDLEWNLARSADGKRLRIDYSLKNKTAQKIYVADQLLAYHEGQIKLVPTRMIVSADRQPGVVRFSRAVVRTGTTQFDHPPGATALEPGATHKGSAELELPLKGWHNYAPPPPIPDKPTSAVLEIAYLSGPIEWGAVKTTDGVEVTIPQLPAYRAASKIARSEPRPLP